MANRRKGKRAKVRPFKKTRQRRVFRDPIATTVNCSRSIVCTVGKFYGTDVQLAALTNFNSTAGAFCTSKSPESVYYVGDVSAAIAYSRFYINSFNFLANSKLGYRQVSSGVVSWYSNFNQSRIESLEIKYRPLNNASQRGGSVYISLTPFENSGDYDVFRNQTGTPDINAMRMCTRFMTGDVAHPLRMVYRVKPYDNVMFTYNSLDSMRFGITIRYDHQIGGAIADDQLAGVITIRARVSVRTGFSASTESRYGNDTIKSSNGPNKVSVKTAIGYGPYTKDYGSQQYVCDRLDIADCTLGDKRSRYLFVNEKKYPTTVNSLSDMELNSDHE